MKVLVTGGAGFVGHNLALRLDHSGHDVTALDNLSNGLERNLWNSSVRLRIADVAEVESFNALDSNYDSVVHLAALGSVPRSLRAPREVITTNVLGTLNALEFARRNGAHFILASSSSVYGENQTVPMRETSAIRPVSPYAASKASAEQLALVYARAYDLEILVFRLFNVYGPGQRWDAEYPAVIPVWIDAALNDSVVAVNGDGEQVRDFTFVDDVVSVMEKSITKRERASQPINLAFGAPMSLNSVLHLLEETLGREIRREHRLDRQGDIRNSFADASALKALFPDITGTALPMGLERTIEWVRGMRIQQL